MGGGTHVVQPWMPRAARDKRCVPLAREHRGWREAPRMYRSRCAGILQRTPLRADGVPGGLELDQRLAAPERVLAGGPGHALDGLRRQLVDLRGERGLARG